MPKLKNPALCATPACGKKISNEQLTKYGSESDHSYAGAFNDVNKSARNNHQHTKEVLATELTVAKHEIQQNLEKVCFKKVMSSIQRLYRQTPCYEDVVGI